MSSTAETLVEIGMPRLSDSMEEASVLRWLKRPGDSVARGEPLVEIETDKATVVYEAERDGVLAEILVEDGETAVLGAPIARLRSDGAAAATPSPAEPAATPAQAEQAEPARRAEPARPAAKPARARATPVARRLARRLGVPVHELAGTGPGGRIVAADVRAARPATPAADDGRAAGTAVELTPTQRTIAARMTESRATIPEFTLEVEIDMEAAAALRVELRHLGREPVPSFNDLVVCAAALALREFPALNASYEPDRVVRHEHVHVGIAVDVEDALLVPTIRDADRKSVFELAAAARDLAERARARRLSPDDLADGTFTVSNLGMFGVRRFHAVINPPQAAILAVGEVAPRAVVDRGGALVARTTMEVTLACDHRVVYGAEAGRFLGRLRELLEHPLALVLEQ